VTIDNIPYPTYIDASVDTISEIRTAAILYYCWKEIKKYEDGLAFSGMMAISISITTDLLLIN
jgi:hypothetical protein